jgi:hypothetical protein
LGSGGAGRDHLLLQLLYAGEVVGGERGVNLMVDLGEALARGDIALKAA